MAASKAELQTMVGQWRKRLPGLREKQYLKLAAIQGGEGGVASEPEGHRYTANNEKLEENFTGKQGVKARHAEVVAAIKKENEVIEKNNKLITDPTKKLEKKPVPTRRQWLRQWNDDLMAKAKAGTITREEHRKQFFDVVYADTGGADYAGIGSFQVTGKENTIEALKAYGAQGKEFAKILENDPSAINSLKKNPDFLEAANTGWVKQNLLKTGIIDKSMRAVANKVNPKEAAENKEKKVNNYINSVKGYQANLGVTVDGDWGGATEAAWNSLEREGYKAYPTETPTPKTSEQQIPYPVTPTEVDARAQFAQQDPRRIDLNPEPQYATMEDLLVDRNLMGTRGL